MLDVLVALVPEWSSHRKPKSPVCQKYTSVSLLMVRALQAIELFPVPHSILVWWFDFVCLFLFVCFVSFFGVPFDFSE